MSWQYKQPAPGARAALLRQWGPPRCPRPAHRTRGDIGPDNFCGEIKVLESDRFLFSQHLSKSGWDSVSLMRGQCGSNHVYTGHSPHDLDSRHCINICQSLSRGSGHNPASCWITAQGDKVVKLSQSWPTPTNRDRRALWRRSSGSSSRFSFWSSHNKLL